MHFSELVCRVGIARIQAKLLFERRPRLQCIAAGAVAGRFFEKRSADPKSNSRTAWREGEHLAVLAQCSIEQALAFVRFARRLWYALRGVARSSAGTDVYVLVKL